MTGPLYDRIGEGYDATRQPDPRIAVRIRAALGISATAVNIGAGAGSYEPPDIPVIAVEPSLTMIRQRSAASAPVVQAVAEDLPFPDRAFDAALAVLSVHHWEDKKRGLDEMRRVARERAVVMSWDPAVVARFWLLEYFPCIRDFDRPRELSVSAMAELLGGCDVSVVPIPADCRDGFLGGFWRRPAAYLDPRVRGGISAFSAVPENELSSGLTRLADDLSSGAWHRRYRALLELNELDVGYRLFIAG